MCVSPPLSLAIHLIMAKKRLFPVLQKTTEADGALELNIKYLKPKREKKTHKESQC